MRERVLVSCGVELFFLFSLIPSCPTRTKRPCSGDSLRGSSGSGRRAPKAVLEFLEKSGGKIDGTQLSKLYQSHPNMKSAIANAGGLRKLCDTHEGIEFVQNTGAGFVRLQKHKKQASLSGTLSEKPEASAGQPFAAGFQVQCT